MTDIKDRIRDNIPENITQQEFADNVGISISTLRGWLSGRSKPTFEYIDSLAKNLNKSIEWVITGKESNKEKELVTDVMYSIDVYNVEMAAGSGAINYEEEIIDKYQLSKGFFEKHLLRPKSTAGVFIKGDSMEPRFKGGDIAIIDMSVKRFETDGIYAFCYDGHCFIKHLQLVGRELYAISSNSLYERWQIEETANFKIIGMVKAAICRV